MTKMKKLSKPKAKKSNSKTYIIKSRSAKTGKFVTEEFASKHKSTTVREKSKKKK